MQGEAHASRVTSQILTYAKVSFEDDDHFSLDYFADKDCTKYMELSTDNGAKHRLYFKSTEPVSLTDMLATMEARGTDKLN